LYNLKHYNEDTGSYEWVCGTDTSGNPIASIPIQKSYLIATGDDDGDPSNFTMACINAALGKCVMWGYQVYNQSYPETYSGTTKYRDLGVSHQACQRMVRADYCGNGTPHTANGTPIDVYDTYGIQTPDNLAGNSLEAEWRPDGAHCIQHTRWGTADSATTAGLTDLQYVQTYCPGRLAVNEAGCNNDSASSFYKNNGFGLTDQKQRSILRNQSYQH
ncbi:MAG TPA: ADYC domain-containing protein, partial [Pseudomonadota bacterium]|nr:ADYC domain-containing protein [Pseudomonadota bacterium]